MSGLWSAYKPLVALTITLLAAWLLLPILRPVHVEGFSAALVSLGLHFANGSVPDFMPFAPFNSDYLGLTKFGVVLWVAEWSPWLGGEAALRLLMLVGLVSFIASSAWLVKAWSGASMWTVAPVMLVVPGVGESAFYFNDNLPAAGLLFAGLVLLVRWRSIWAAMGAGVLIAYAVCIRVDVGLVAAFAVPLVICKANAWRRSIWLLALVGIAGLAVLTGIFAMAGVTPLDALRSGMTAVRLWQRLLDAHLQAREFIYFLGLPGICLALIGTVQLVRERQWYFCILLSGIPMLFILMQFGMIWQARQFLVLLPFILALAARGVVVLVGMYEAGQKIPATTVLLLTLVVFFGPVRALRISDGPHEYIGRLAGIRLWADWQGEVRKDFAELDRLIDMSQTQNGRPMIVLTDGWNDDRYLELRLTERGFKRTPIPPICDLLGVGFEKDGETIVQLSLRASFVPSWPLLQPLRLRYAAIPCAEAFESRSLFFLVDHARAARFLHGVPARRRQRADLLAAGIEAFVALPLNAQSLAELHQSYLGDVRPVRGPQTVDAAYEAVRSRTVFSRPQQWEGPADYLPDSLSSPTD